MAAPRETSPAEIYAARRSRYEDICTEVTYAAEKELKTQGIKYHSVTSRVKTLESYLEKIERKAYSEPSEQMTDLAGIRIVCLFMTDLGRVGDILASLFDVISKEDKVNQGRAEVFGYMSHHYICKFSSTHTGPRYDHLKDLNFEVQVRTILMDAWANISHYLSYKNEDSVPQELLRDFAAMSGLLFVADRQFEGLYKASSMSAANAEEEILRGAEIPPSEVNADTVNALLLREYPNRRSGNDALVSTLTSELRAAGFHSIEKVARTLQVIRTIATEIESTNAPEDEVDGKFNSAAFARLSLTIADSNYREVFAQKAEDRGRFDSVMETMLNIARERGYEEDSMAG